MLITDKNTGPGGAAAGRKGATAMTEKQVSLSAGEWRIMECLWEGPSKTLMEIVREVMAASDWSKSTVVTMVGRLESKGALTYEEGRPRIYHAAVSRDQAALRETESLLSRVYQGSLGMLVNTLADGRGLSQEDIDELSAVLERARRKKK